MAEKGTYSDPRCCTCKPAPITVTVSVAEWVGLIEDLLPRDGVIDDKCSLANEIAYMIVEKLEGNNKCP